MNKTLMSHEPYKVTGIGNIFCLISFNSTDDSMLYKGMKNDFGVRYEQSLAFSWNRESVKVCDIWA